jgi:hypothetical protein
MTEVWNREQLRRLADKLSEPAMRIALVLEHHADENGIVSGVPVSRLAAESKATGASWQRGISKLIQAGMLDKAPRPFGQPTTYQLTLPMQGGAA